MCANQNWLRLLDAAKRPITNSIIDGFSQKANIAHNTRFRDIQRFHPALLAIGFNPHSKVGVKYHVLSRSKVRPVTAMSR
ncbi:MAG: hypothetical protein PHD13_07595 [Methanocellales archaeon]|nr:hypothetical protein [Methanocellales archaeon]MDD3292435.1 hypothetical protein [Methanocellales archaeon]MDD5236018.1 hypothetical protein [Methanocellales archaeon]MDD5485903.1 hypothetical protein [Methanocellales archaeon]